MFGITGLQTLLPLSLDLVKNGNISMNDLVRLTSYTPAKLIKKKTTGGAKSLSGSLLI